MHVFFRMILREWPLGIMWSKEVWKKRIWKRAWELEDGFWCVQMRCHRSLDLLSTVCVLTKYVIWWTIADNNHSLMRVCGTMVKLVTHSSLLRLDDVRLRTANVRPFLQ